MFYSELSCDVKSQPCEYLLCDVNDCRLLFVKQQGNAVITTQLFYTNIFWCLIIVSLF